MPLENIIANKIRKNTKHESCRESFNLQLCRVLQSLVLKDEGSKWAPNRGCCEDFSDFNTWKKLGFFPSFLLTSYMKLNEIRHSNHIPIRFKAHTYTLID